VAAAAAAAAAAAVVVVPNRSMALQPTRRTCTAL
jgi:hypothetical protein